MLDVNIQQQLKGYLERLEQPIQLMTTLDSSDSSAQMRELVNEIAALSDKVNVVETNDADSTGWNFYLKISKKRRIAVRIWPMEWISRSNPNRIRGRK